VIRVRVLQALSQLMSTEGLDDMAKSKLANLGVMLVSLGHDLTRIIPEVLDP